MADRFELLRDPIAQRLAFSQGASRHSGTFDMTPDLRVPDHCDHRIRRKVITESGRW